jgi:hypothetical protein
MPIHGAGEVRVIDKPGPLDVRCRRCKELCLYNERMKVYHCLNCGSMVTDQLASEISSNPQLQLVAVEVTERKADANPDAQ